jgi:hypothetical protein
LVDIDKLSDKEKIELARKGICPNCGKGIETKRESEGNVTTQYFSCGHKHFEVSIVEKITLSDSLKVETKKATYVFSLDGEFLRGLLAGVSVLLLMVFAVGILSVSADQFEFVRGVLIGAIVVVVVIVTRLRGFF